MPNVSLFNLAFCWMTLCLFTTLKAYQNPLFDKDCKDFLIKNLPDHAFKASSPQEPIGEFEETKSKENKVANDIGNDAKKPDSKINQKTTYSAQNIRQNSNSAWCPTPPIQNRFDEFVEVDLQSTHIIRTIQIRGFFALNRKMPYFQIKYKRFENDTNWRIYQVENSYDNLLVGLLESKKINVIELDRIIIARWLRIYPYSYENTNVCLIMEAYGCQFSNSIEEYKTHQGSINLFNDKIKFTDNQYDGIHDTSTNLITQGLGLLTDYRIPSLDDNLPRPDRENKINHYFIGWNKANLPDKTRPIDVIFKFATFQKCNSATLYTVSNSLFNIKLPKKITIKSSLDGVNYETVNDHLSNPNERQFLDTFLQLDIDMKDSQVKFVLISMEFASDWILLSEVFFKCEPIDINLEELLRVKTVNSSLTTNSLDPPNGDHEENSFGKGIINNSEKNIMNTFSAKDFYLSNPSSVIVSVIVLLILFVLFLGCFAIFSCIWLHRRRLNRKQNMHQEQTKNLILTDNQGFNQPYQNTNGSSRSGSTLPTIDVKQTQRRSCSMLNVKTDMIQDRGESFTFWYFLKMIFCGKMAKYSKHSGSSSSSHDPSTSITSNQNSSQNGGSTIPGNNLQVVNGMVQIDFSNQNRTPTLFFPGTPMMPFNHSQQSSNHYMNVDPQLNQQLLNYSTLSNLTQNYSNEQILSLMGQINQNNNNMMMQQAQLNSHDLQSIYSPINQDDDGNMSCEYASTGTMSEKNPKQNSANQAPSPPPNHPNRQNPRPLIYNQTLPTQQFNQLYQGSPLNHIQQTLLNRYNQHWNVGNQQLNYNYNTQKQPFHQNPPG